MAVGQQRLPDTPGPPAAVFVPMLVPMRVFVFVFVVVFAVVTTLLRLHGVNVSEPPPRSH